MKTIAIINNKGGVGKTSTVTSIAHILAERFNKSVLVVDMDPQSNTSCQYSRIDYVKILLSILEHKTVSLDPASMNDISEELLEKLTTKNTVQDILLNPSIPTESAIVPTIYNNLDILPSMLTLATAEQQILSDTSSPQQFRLAKKLKEVENMYDYCIVDCSPSVSLLNINVLNAADEVYIPVNTDGYSLIGMAITKNLIDKVSEYNPKLKIGGVFFNQFSKQTVVAKTTYSFLENILEEYDVPLLPITIPTTKFLQKNSIMQEPLYRANPKGKATEAFIDLCEYILSSDREEFVKKYKLAKNEEENQ